MTEDSAPDREHIIFFTRRGNGAPASPTRQERIIAWVRLNCPGELPSDRPGHEPSTSQPITQMGPLLNAHLIAGCLQRLDARHFAGGAAARDRRVLEILSDPDAFDRRIRSLLRGILPGSDDAPPAS